MPLWEEHRPGPTAAEAPRRPARVFINWVQLLLNASGFMFVSNQCKSIMIPERSHLDLISFLIRIFRRGVRNGLNSLYGILQVTDLLTSLFYEADHMPLLHIYCGKKKTESGNYVIFRDNILCELSEYS